MVCADTPLFSVIIPTRNRSAVFAAALHSVLEQRFRTFEVIVVDDGSAAEHQPRYRELIEAARGIARIITLQPAARGHGPSFVRNCGAAEATGDYLCFLDDDDQWSDPDHLSRVAGVVAASAEPVDLILADQQAFLDGTPVAGPVWIEDLKERLNQAPDRAGAYAVTSVDLLACPAHCHLNTTVMRRSFYRELGGFDERLRYEEDRDLYLRALDRATSIKYFPVTVSRHNIPHAGATNLSTSESELAKRLDQLRVFDKAVLLSAQPELRRYAMRQRAYMLQYIAAEAARLGSADSARYYAMQALTARLSGSMKTVGTLAGAARRFLGSPQLGQIAGL
ncbi:MAG TPA: glycosyltransferase family A protein [Stellaceae bacterium]|nr:glycosyltransferase family A protein [Stellaceae bacterium]